MNDNELIERMWDALCITMQPTQEAMRAVLAVVREHDAAVLAVLAVVREHDAAALAAKDEELTAAELRYHLLASELVRLRAAIKEEAEAVLFHDGVGADLRSEGITTIETAYMAGRQEVLDALRAAGGES